MTDYSSYQIKSFKHDGHLHRTWLDNWLVPREQLLTEHVDQAILILVNYKTQIQEADGRIWISKNPGVSFFIPGKWYNIVALIESSGIRYYCNIASPPFLSGSVLTYIDYDLDVILTPMGESLLVDEDEFERHKISYHYSQLVQQKVRTGLVELTKRMDARQSPFLDEEVMYYYRLWQKRKNKQGT